MNTLRAIVASASLALIFTAGLPAQQQNRPTRRLESVTWNPVEHKLTWTVVDGSVGEKNKFEAGKKTTFVIQMDEATMSLDGEDRRFSKTEAVSVHRLMDMVAKYAAESTIWWEAGEGEPLRDGGSKVDRKKTDPDAGDLDRMVPKRARPTPSEGKEKIIRISVEDLQAMLPAQTVE